MGWGPFGAPGWGYDMVSPPGPNLLSGPTGLAQSTESWESTVVLGILRNRAGVGRSCMQGKVCRLSGVSALRGQTIDDLAFEQLALQV